MTLLLESLSVLSEKRPGRRWGDSPVDITRVAAPFECQEWSYPAVFVCPSFVARSSLHACEAGRSLFGPTLRNLQRRPESQNRNQKLVQEARDTRCTLALTISDGSSTFPGSVRSIFQTIFYSLRPLPFRILLGQTGHCSLLLSKLHRLQVVPQPRFASLHPPASPNGYHCTHSRVQRRHSRRRWSWQECAHFALHEGLFP